MKKLIASILASSAKEVQAVGIRKEFIGRPQALKK